MTKPKQTGLHWLDKGSDREGRPLCGRPFPQFARGISRAFFAALSAVRPRISRAASARALRFALCPSAGPRFAAAFLPFVRKTMLFVKKVLKKGLTYGIMAADGRGKI